MKKLINIFLLLCFATIAMQAQDVNEQEDRQLITETIEMYFDGWLTGDTTKVGQAMHATCHLKVLRDGQLLDISRAEYLSKFKPRPRLKNAAGRIEAIDITGHIAAAKCELSTANRVFTDYFNMMKVGDRWYIVDKISMSQVSK